MKKILNKNKNNTRVKIATKNNVFWMLFNLSAKWHIILWLGYTVYHWKISSHIAEDLFLMNERQRKKNVNQKAKKLDSFHGKTERIYSLSIRVYCKCVNLPYYMSKFIVAIFCLLFNNNRYKIEWNLYFVWAKKDRCRFNLSYWKKNTSRIYLHEYYWFKQTRVWIKKIVAICSYIRKYLLWFNECSLYKRTLNRNKCTTNENLIHISIGKSYGLILLLK